MLMGYLTSLYLNSPYSALDVGWRWPRAASPATLMLHASLKSNMLNQR